MTIPTGLAALSIVVLSSYALSQSIGSINNVQIYEEKAKKAADWSNAAKESLWKTRTTIGAGFVSCLVSLLSGVAYLAFVSNGGAIWSGILSGASFAVAQYIQSFWSAKPKLPLLDQYNAAIKQSMDVTTVLYLLSAGWTAVTLLRLFGL